MIKNSVGTKIKPPPTPSNPEANPTDIPTTIKQIINSKNKILTPF
jgi:hypothetical protein